MVETRYMVLILDFSIGIETNYALSSAKAKTKKKQPKIKGFDISEQAIQIIKYGVGDNSNVNVEIGDICDLNFLSSIPDASFDHIILSHIIGFLSGPDIEQTIDLRQQLIDQLVRICSVSVIILDSIEDIPNIRAEIEQNNRCIVHDRLMNYFLKYTTTREGEMYIMFSDECCSLLYLKKKLGDY